MQFAGEIQPRGCHYELHFPSGDQKVVSHGICFQQNPFCGMHYRNMFCVWNERFLKQEQWWSIKTQKQNFLMRFDLTYFFIPSGFVHLHGFGASVKLSILRLNLIMEDTFLVV